MYYQGLLTGVFLIIYAYMTSDNGIFNTTDPVRDWSLRFRVAVPAPVPDYFDRPALIERLMSTDHPIAVLKAPGGYGKTTLLAAYCRQFGERGLPAAWLRIDASDDRSNFESNLALAFRHAGVDVPESGSDAWRVDGDRVGLLLYAIAARAEPCTLALDNLERLTVPDSTEALNTLMRYAPSNLNVIVACREVPLALDIAEPLLEGRVVILTAADLRFSSRETAAFLGRHPASQELTAIDRQFEGWPIALALHRNSSCEHTSGQADTSNLLGNWIESQLWERLSTDQRDFLLDAGLLDRLDPVLLDEVLDCSDSRYRLRALSEFDGLIQPSPDNNDSSTTVLHPLLRRHCTERRIRGNAETIPENPPPGRVGPRTTW